MKKRTMLSMLMLAGVMTCTSVNAYDTLQKGSSGDAVQKLQETLIEKGLLSGTADGKYGDMTAAAVSQFQAENQMEATGIADDQMQQVLYDDVLTGTWYFTSYEELNKASTPDSLNMHVTLQITDDGISLDIDKAGEKLEIDTTYFLNDGGINFAIENDSSYLLKKDENGNLFMMGASEDKLFPGFRYIFGREEPEPDPEAASESSTEETEEPQEEEQMIDRNVFIHDVDTQEFVAFSDPVTVSLKNTPELLPEEMIPQMFAYGSKTYIYDDASCKAIFNPDRHGYEVYMKLQENESEADEADDTDTPAATGFVPVNPWIYTGDNFEDILAHFLAARNWDPEFTFNASDNSFVIKDDTGKEMEGAFQVADDGTYSMDVIVNGEKMTIYADDFHSYETDWERLVLDPEHEYLEGVIQKTISKEEKEFWDVDADEDTMSGVLEDNDDNEIPFTFEFAISDEGEEYVKITYNGKTIDNISKRS